MAKDLGFFKDRFNKYVILPVALLCIASVLFGLQQPDASNKKPCKLTDFEKKEMNTEGIPLPPECQ